MISMFHVGDRVKRHLNGDVFHGTVVGVFEDIVMVLWDNGVLSALDEQAASCLIMGAGATGPTSSLVAG